MKKCAVNLRIPVAICVCLVLGILLGYAALRTGISWLYFLLPVPALLIVFIVFALIRRSAYGLVPFILCIVFLVTGVVYSSYLFDSNLQKATPSGENYISGTVVSLVIGDDGRQLVLDEVTVGDAALGGKLLVNLATTGGELCDEGDAVHFYAEIEKYDLITYGKINSHIIEGVEYYCSVYAGLTAESGFSLFGSVRSFIRDSLYGALDSSTAGVAFAMMTGETGGIEDGIYSTFRYGGIAHIFAVSGLHIGVIYGALLALCKILKRRGKLSRFVCLAVVFLYSGVCGFTVSSVRAVIMCSVNAVTSLTGNKYDMLNSLSFAVILILLINPLDLFSTGFQLSVLSVAGIALFLAKFRKSLSFMPLGTGDALSVTLSAQTGTFAAMLSSFGYVSAAGLLLNVIIIPILSAVFVLMLFGLVVAAVFYPFSAAIISFCALPLEGVLSVVTLFNFEESVIVAACGTLFILLYYLFAVVLSDKVKKSRLKARVLQIIAVISAIVYGVFVSLYPIGGTFISVSAYYGGGYAVFKNADGCVLVVCGEVYDYRLYSYLASVGADVDVLVFMGDIEVDYIYGLDLDVERAYVSGGNLYVLSSDAFEIISSDKFTEFDMAFTFEDSDTLTVTTNGVKTGICAGEFVPEGCDLLIGDFDFDSDSAADGVYCVNFSEGSGDWCVYSDGNKNFKAKGSLSVTYVF